MKTIRYIPAKGHFPNLGQYGQHRIVAKHLTYRKFSFPSITVVASYKSLLLSIYDLQLVNTLTSVRSIAQAGNSFSQIPSFASTP